MSQMLRAYPAPLTWSFLALPQAQDARHTPTPGVLRFSSYRGRSVDGFLTPLGPGEFQGKGGIVGSTTGSRPVLDLAILLAARSTKAWIEDIPQGVSEQVEGHDHRDYGYSGCQRQPGSE